MVIVVEIFAVGIFLAVWHASFIGPDQIAQDRGLSMILF